MPSFVTAVVATTFFLRRKIHAAPGICLSFTFLFYSVKKRNKKKDEAGAQLHFATKTKR